MKKAVLTIAFLLGGLFALQAQTVPYVSIYDINFVSQANLAACNDTSAYLGDTVRTRGIVVTDGGLSEVPSGSVQGGNRPFIFIVDTANGGAPGPFTGIEVMGVYRNAAGQLVPHPNISNVVAGDVVEIVGIIGVFNNGTQLEVLDANSFSIVGTAPVPTSTVVPVGDFNDQNRINIPTTGEQWEGSFVELQNVTVVELLPFAGGSRISFNIADGNGNLMNVSDRFLAMKLPSHTTVNSASPATTGSFVPPVVGTFYSSLKGVIRHDGNGCFQGAGTRGYEIHPFDASHFTVGSSPPIISNVNRDPRIPTSNQDVELTFNVTDASGTVDTVMVYWSADPNQTPNQFTGTLATLVSGTTDDYEFTIPAQPNGTFVRYYIRAVDNTNDVSFFPATPTGAAQPNVDFYFVRDNGMQIQDIQFTLAQNGASPYANQTVTVRGFVTASTRVHDLGYLYIQDTSSTEWAGIWCVGAGITQFFREEEVEVTGVVEEFFGFTRLQVTSATLTGNRAKVAPVVLDPTDSTMNNAAGLEKYESMLIEYRLPNNDKLKISRLNLGFGEWAISDAINASTARSRRIATGRQVGTTAFFSLYTSIISDSLWITNDGELEVSPVITNDTITFDAIQGIMFFGFSNFKLLPRNNDDFIGVNVPLDSTNLPQSTVSIEEINPMDGIRIYPNPARDYVTIELPELTSYSVEIVDLTGATVLRRTGLSGRNELALDHLRNGMYMMRIATQDGQYFQLNKIMVTK
jgi:hypothetical protein